MTVQWRSGIHCAAWVLCLLLSGCAATVFDQARSHYYAGDPVAGVAVLDQAVQTDEIPSRDTLLLHLERGLMLHRAGLYEESAKAFVQASGYIKEHETISASEQTRSLLSNDWSKSYVGEYNEQLWAHSYAMMSFIMLGEAESAAVEARQALHVLTAHPEPLHNAAFTRGLIGLSFELAGQHNDAYVAYRSLHENNPDSQVFALSTFRAARKVASVEGATKWRKRIPGDLWNKYSKRGPEAVLLLSVGRGPIKRSGSLVYGTERLAFPVYTPVLQAYDDLHIRGANNESVPFERVSTDINSVAVAALEDRGKRVLAKAILRGKVKHDLVKNLSSHDETAAQVLKFVFFLLEEADTRSWQSLPGHLNLVRVPLVAGQTELKVQLGNQEKRLVLDPAKEQNPQVFSLRF